MLIQPVQLQNIPLIPVAILPLLLQLYGKSPGKLREFNFVWTPCNRGGPCNKGSVVIKNQQKLSFSTKGNPIIDRAKCIR